MLLFIWVLLKVFLENHNFNMEWRFLKTVNLKWNEIVYRQTGNLIKSSFFPPPLLIFTCNNILIFKGCASLCVASSSLCSFQTTQRTATGNSLMHNIMKLATQTLSENGIIQQMTFNLLANLVVSQDCKGVLQKVGIQRSEYSDKIQQVVLVLFSAQGRC